MSDSSLSTNVRFFSGAAVVRDDFRVTMGSAVAFAAGAAVVFTTTAATVDAAVGASCVVGRFAGGGLFDVVAVAAADCLRAFLGTIVGMHA